MHTRAPRGLRAGSAGSAAAKAACRSLAPRPSRSGARVVARASAGDGMQVFSPSKVNLFLRIVRRREDGYHDLASLFHVIDLGDDMELEVLPPGAGEDLLQCSDPTIPCDGRNLVIKALNLFRAKTGEAARFRVRLDKRVPHGAGLGGGSGNAATTLWAANELAGRPASDAQLLEWSGEIGSDISVFFSSGAAYCTGRGEIVEDVPPPLPLDTPLLLVKPPIGLSTPQIFKALDLGRRSAAEPRALLGGLAAAGRLSDALCVNDLEQPAFDTLPELLALKRRLAAAGDAAGRRFDAVFMTGSGSTIVCAGSDAAPAFLSEDPDCAGVFVSPARLLTRRAGEWYAAPAGGPRAGAAAAAAGAAKTAAAA
ncbi:4-diphosphocytidyl-2-C-methyl-D-erythritol kinase [Raphidocelis subcapitata]|uniref:4-diphosphocytidyl-2-C-methyl-D-erythritol kinase n=1 Tax=Raphidocelis subcapitata TaxID=307507 RepID=A0A2V0NXR9_9CHLO|nr:4-diphosphocytidyl-2-C-methyl-D-erythritol kinase [Raphidocelis subcapitata]|eukprot:GBF90380.1 4-diphosphocytidyl-2-C-methyl-D-erythritol kinase [Raphidocelis subcapitata]